MAEFMQPSDPLSTCGDEEILWTQHAFADHMHLSQVPAKASVTDTSQGITDLSQPSFCHCPGHCNIVMCHLQAHIYALKGKQDP